MGEPYLPEAVARHICHTAMLEDRCAELLECLMEGGAVTVDRITGAMVLITADQLETIK